MSRMERNIIIGMVALVAAIVFGLVAVSRVGASHEAPFAQEGDVIVTEPAPFDIGQWLNENDTMLFIIVIVALVASIGRQPLLELIRGGIANVPPGVFTEVLRASMGVALETADKWLAARQIEAEKTPTPLDDAAVRELREGIVEDLKRLFAPQLSPPSE